MYKLGMKANLSTLAPKPAGVNTGILALLLALLLLASTALLGQTLPSGFADELVTSVTSPTAIAFLPDARMLITTQPGQVRIWNGSQLLPAAALNLAGSVCSNSERGLLGIAVDPDFSSNGHVFLYYTYNSSGSCGTGSLDGPVNRVSRFTFVSENTIDPNSELVLIDNIWSFGSNHNGGDVEVGGDGMLYIATGDGGTDYGGSGSGGNNRAARDRHHLLGKILRITRDGQIPPDNPFVGGNSVRCHEGAATPGEICQETYSWGLRNPFRFAFDPNDGHRTFYINDVGQNAWEEINLGIAGADYGWNEREGPCVTGSTTDCSPQNPPPAGMTDPIFAYRHSANVPGTSTGGCRSITGAAFIPKGIWPASFDGGFLFADFICGGIFVMKGTGASLSVEDLAQNLGSNSAVHLRFGPHASGQALYYTTYAGGGQVRRISAEQAEFTTVSAASLDEGPMARGSIVSGFGSQLASASANATETPLPTELGGVSVRITPDGQAGLLAPLFFVSPEQINYQIPSHAPVGRATVEVLEGSDIRASGSVLVQDVGPGIFTGNQSGRGLAAADAVLVKADGSQEPRPVLTCPGGPQPCQPVPLSLAGPGEQLFLILYATGIRHAPPGTPVRVLVDAQELEVTYAGAQLQFEGLDQVNVILPNDLQGGREIELRLAVGHEQSNPVTVVLE